MPVERNAVQSRDLRTGNDRSWRRGWGAVSAYTGVLFQLEAGMNSGERLELLTEGFLQHLVSPEYFLFLKKQHFIIFFFFVRV